MIHIIIHYIDGRVAPIHRCLFILIVCICIHIQAEGQYAPVVGYPGTTAIPYDSSAIVAWATGCSIQRGYRDIAVPDSGYASIGDSASAIGSATTAGVVSLGDGGSAILTFDQPIINGAGFDFAVFENGFSAGGPGMAFLELAFVEVSSDGTRYVRFPTSDNVQDTIQLGNGGFMDGSRLNNLAGKYVYGYGTPFDLDELRDSAGLDVNNITHVKVIDVVGSIDSQYATHDSRGFRINDPYPTNFASSGFDLDAVGVIHQRSANGVSAITTDDRIQVYPNPASSRLHIHAVSSGPSSLTLTTVSGQEVRHMSFDQSINLDISQIPAGVYTLRIVDQEQIFSSLIIKE